MDGEATGTTKCWIEEELEVLILGEALVESAKVDILRQVRQVLEYYDYVNSVIAERLQTAT